MAGRGNSRGWARSRAGGNNVERSGGCSGKATRVCGNDHDDSGANSCDTWVSNCDT